MHDLRRRGLRGFRPPVVSRCRRGDRLRYPRDSGLRKAVAVMDITIAGLAIANKAMSAPFPFSETRERPSDDGGGKATSRVVCGSLGRFRPLFGRELDPNKRPQLFDYS